MKNYYLYDPSKEKYKHKHKHYVFHEVYLNLTIKDAYKLKQYLYENYCVISETSCNKNKYLIVTIEYDGDLNLGFQKQLTLDI